MFFIIQAMCLLCAVLGTIGWFSNADSSKKYYGLIPAGLWVLGFILPYLFKSTLTEPLTGVLTRNATMVVLALQVIGGVVGVLMFQEARSMKIDRLADED